MPRIHIEEEKGKRPKCSKSTEYKMGDRRRGGQ
jgi:hypothetical protein